MMHLAVSFPIAECWNSSALRPVVVQKGPFCAWLGAVTLYPVCALSFSPIIDLPALSAWPSPEALLVFLPLCRSMHTAVCSLHEAMCAGLNALLLPEKKGPSGGVGVLDGGLGASSSFSLFDK